MQWHYHWVGGKDGDPIVLVFVVEPENLEQLGTADLEMIESIALKTPEGGPRPVPASQSGKSDGGAERVTTVVIIVATVRGVCVPAVGSSGLAWRKSYVYVPTGPAGAWKCGAGSGRRRCHGSP